MKNDNRCQQTDGIVEINNRAFEEKIRDFGELLKQLETLDEKRKLLWKEIYENAISDRQNAFVMFAKLFKIVQDKSTEHAVHGKNIATYIERMSKANDQLIKLAELVVKADGANNDTIDSEELFKRINSHQ